MFTIDLLKGKNIPARTQPQTIVVGALIAVVPVIAAIIMVSSFVLMGTEMAIARQRIAQYDSKIEKLSGPLSARKKIEKEIKTVADAQREVVSCLPQFTQWFDIVNDIVLAMPDSMVLNKLQVSKVSRKIKAPKKGDAKTLVETSVSVPEMRLNLSGTGGSSYDLVVKEFRDKLLAASSLKGRLEGIRVATEPESYELCLDFKVDSREQ